MKLRIGSRGSRLALWQAEHVKARLEEAHAGIQVEIRVLQTTGDRITDVPLARIGDKGLFTKELDRALLDGEIDAAVHSLKDVPTRLPGGLTLGAVPEREDPRDVFLPAPGRPDRLASLAPGARIGTSSLRRRALLLHLRPDLVVSDLRGNLDTRFARLQAGAFDGILLARAGVRRLGRDEAIGEILDPSAWIPAVGQGALGIAARSDDAATLELLEPLHDARAGAAVTAERAFLRALEGGCQIPIGALAVPEGDGLRMSGFVAGLDGKPFLRAEGSAPVAEAEALGVALAQELLDRGADEVLAAIRALDPRPLPGVSPP